MLSAISHTYGQTIRVVDNVTLKPIIHATINNSDSSLFEISNEKGQVSISKFAMDDLLVFRHSAYYPLQIKKSELMVSGQLVRLTYKVVQIDEIVISANKWEQDHKRVANQILPISTKSIEFHNSQTAADILGATGKIFVQKSQLGGGSPMIRGFGANSVLIVVDGIRMNNAIFRSGNLQNIINIDPNMIDGTEVIFGPGSVVYGSDALGGVMDFHTSRVNLSGHKDKEVNALVRFASANKERTFHVDWKIIKPKFGYAGGFTVGIFDDLRSGSVRPEKYPEFGKRTFYVDQINNRDSIIQNQQVNVQIPSAYAQYNTLHKLKWQTGKSSSIQYTFNLSTTGDIPRYDRLIEIKDDIPVNAEWYYGPQFWMMNALTFELKNPSSIYNDLRITLGKQDYTESRMDRKFESENLRTRKESVVAYTANVDLNKTIDENSQLFYGIEYTLNDVDSRAQQEAINSGEVSTVSSRYPDGGSLMQTMAAYATIQMPINKALNASVGMRYNHARLDSKIKDESYPYDKIIMNNSALSGSAGLVYLPTPNWQINLLGSSGFRAPNVDDAAKVFDSEPGNVIVPNPGLKPEYSYNAEISTSVKIREIVKLELGVFHSWLVDAMVRGDFSFNGQDSIYYDGTLSKVQTTLNTGEARVYGLEGLLSIDLSRHIAFQSNFNITRGRDIINDEPLRHTTPFFGRTSVLYRARGLQIDLYALYNSQRKFSDLPPSERNKPHLYTEDGTPAWITLNLKGSYQINPFIQFNMGIENIFDVHYRPYSSGISAPGRNFIFSVRATI